MSVVIAAGCGGSDDSNGGATPTSTEAASAGGGASTGGETNGGGGAPTLTIAMADYSFTPNAVTTQAGPLTIKAPNSGQFPHELVLLKTDQSPTSLPHSATEVDEEGLEKSGVDSPGEIEDVGPGQTKSGQFKLTPGKYVMICNLPGHFAQGMYGTITVK